jgi:peroxiredoxin
VMEEKQFSAVKLKGGALSPDFSLETADNHNKQIVTREQFRGKSGLVLIFFQPTPNAVELLKRLEQDDAEYKELNSRVIGIGHASADDLAQLAEDNDINLMLLADPQGSAWKKYAGTDQPGYGVYVLDTYGGVDSQRAAASIGELPSAAQILEWTRGAQYRCSI